MKKQIVFLATLFFGVAVVQAEEQISSISFNPSRLGLFEQLRLTEGLTSHGNVTVENAINIRQNTGLKATNGLDVKDTIDAEQGRVTIPDTQLKVTGSMAVNGGFALFKGASTLGGLPANTWVHAPTLNLDTLTITGSNDGALLFDPDSYAQGLVLGGNDIPVPNHSECTGGLSWVTRKAADGKTYDVLAVTGCTEGGTGGGEEDPGTPPVVNCWGCSGVFDVNGGEPSPISQTAYWDSGSNSWKFNGGVCCNPGNNYCSGMSSGQVEERVARSQIGWTSAGTGPTSTYDPSPNSSLFVSTRPTAGACCNKLYYTTDPNTGTSQQNRTSYYCTNYDYSGPGQCKKWERWVCNPAPRG